MITPDWLAVQFTQVSLLHILLILGIPYFIFYIFQKNTKFDVFPEKWEAALFVFTFGGLATFGSIQAQTHYDLPFYLPYAYSLLILISILLIIHKLWYSSRKQRFVVIELYDGTRYWGLCDSETTTSLRLGSTKKHKIMKSKNRTAKPQELKSREIIFKKQHIKLVFS